MYYGACMHHSAARCDAFAQVKKVGLFTRLYCQAQLAPINAQFDGVMQLCDYPHENDAHKIHVVIDPGSPKHPHAQRLFESFLLPGQETSLL
ncbi:hypothetical protein SAMN05421880_10529 [Nitrosomonas nitrosa]|uniref:Uncharacterized protein n=1 Tax=Nitrosomonas nitrosa TaxID=52442 RepID=A0A1I4MPI5_9PROT|nr:hypothetical protein SAMN05421880_10529 [Nitrosomonas nitrosa]